MSLTPLFWKVRVAVKTFAARHWLLIEFCHDCGAEQPLVWGAPDPLWLRVYGSMDGVLCPRCFERRARAKHLPMIRWVPTLDRER